MIVNAADRERLAAIVADPTDRANTSSRRIVPASADSGSAQTVARTVGPAARQCRARLLWGRRQFALDEMKVAARRLRAETTWQKQAVEATIDDLHALQADLAGRILSSDRAAEPDPLSAWSAAHEAELRPMEPLIRELRATTIPELAMLVASRQLRHALG